MTDNVQKTRNCLSWRSSAYLRNSCSERTRAQIVATLVSLLLSPARRSTPRRMRRANCWVNVLLLLISGATHTCVTSCRVKRMQHFACET
jgi:hypothetical protein